MTPSKTIYAGNADGLFRLNGSASVGSDVGQTPKIRVLENPCTNLLRISYHNFRSMEFNCYVRSISGSIIKGVRIDASSESGQYEFDIGDLTTGVYIVEFIGNSLNSRALIIKQ
jgi:hypothetical protein